MRESQCDLGKVPGSRICCRWSHTFLHQQKGEQVLVISDWKIILFHDNVPKIELPALLPPLLARAFKQGQIPKSRSVVEVSSKLR